MRQIAAAAVFGHDPFEHRDPAVQRGDFTGQRGVFGVVAAQRSPQFPDTPTLAEAGIDVEGDALFGVYAPAGVSRDIVLRLNREIGRIMQAPEARAVLATFAAEVVTMPPDEFAAIQQRDREKFGAFIHEANIRAD